MPRWFVVAPKSYNTPDTVEGLEQYLRQIREYADTVMSKENERQKDIAHGLSYLATTTLHKIENIKRAGETNKVTYFV